MRRSSCRLPLAARDTANCQKARQVGHFRPDKCPCGLPWDECPWSETVCGGLLGNRTGRITGVASPSKFVCPRCGAVSYNPNDIRELYCGRCHVFLSESCERALAVGERREATV
jgi:ribosomal protein S27AE